MSTAQNNQTWFSFRHSLVIHNCCQLPHFVNNRKLYATTASVHRLLTIKQHFVTSFFPFVVVVVVFISFTATFFLSFQLSSSCHWQMNFVVKVASSPLMILSDLQCHLPFSHLLFPKPTSPTLLLHLLVSPSLILYTTELDLYSHNNFYS